MDTAFPDKLFSVLRNFMEYGSYQGKVDKAVGVIRKAFPQRSKEELTLLFQQCIEAYKESIVLVRENMDHYSAGLIPEAEKEFRKKHSGISDPMISWIIAWVYHWYHER